MRELRICLFLAELNELLAQTTDISNDFLESVANKKVCIRAGPEFDKLEGHLLVYYKFCYGLKISGARFTEMISQYLTKECRFTKEKVKDEIYCCVSKDGTHYKYPYSYIDDLFLQLTTLSCFLNNLKSVLS